MFETSPSFKNILPLAMESVSLVKYVNSWASSIANPLLIGVIVTVKDEVANVPVVVDGAVSKLEDFS